MQSVTKNTLEIKLKDKDCMAKTQPYKRFKRAPSQDNYRLNVRGLGTRTLYHQDRHELPAITWNLSQQLLDNIVPRGPMGGRTGRNRK